MSKKHELMAAERKANRTARLAPLHAAQVGLRAAERVERAAVWTKKRKKAEAAKEKVAKGV